MRKGTHRFDTQATLEVLPLSQSMKEKPVNHLALLMEAIEKKKREDAQQQKQLLHVNDSDSSPSPSSMKKSSTNIIPLEDAASPSQGTRIIQNMLNKKLEEKFSSAILQSLNKYGFQSKNIQTYDLSKGIGLALLSKVLGVNKIKEKFRVHQQNIRRTKAIGNLEIRLKIQQRMSIEIGRILHKVDFNVVKMYWKSKKNVYGIENELHLVEKI